jgi:hypothetical protein
MEEGVGEDVEEIVPHMYVEQTIARQNFIGKSAFFNFKF